mgnify:CR=1 FL=1
MQSAVRFAAMPDRQDLKRVPETVKADAVVADAKPVFLRVRIFQPFDVAFFREKETCRAL